MRIFRPAGAPTWLETVLASVERLFRDIMPAPFKLWRSATAGLPPAEDYAGALAWDESAGLPTWSNGSAWASPSLSTHAHAAAAITFAPAGGLVAADVQAALQELDAEKLAASAYTAADVLAKLLTVDGPGSGLDADMLDGFSSAAFATAVHGHAIMDVAGLQSALDLKAPLASPALTGAPTAPTAAAGTATTQLATTAFADRMHDLAGVVAKAGSYTLVAGDRGRLLIWNAGGAATLTIPPGNLHAAGTKIMVANITSGAISLARGVGVALFHLGGAGATNADRALAIGGWAELIKYGNGLDQWIVIGTGIS